MMNVSFIMEKLHYTDDIILMGPNKEEVDTLVKRLGDKFKIEDQGELSDNQMEHWSGHNQLLLSQF
jgi:hypothetical protein